MRINQTPAEESSLGVIDDLIYRLLETFDLEYKRLKMRSASDCADLLIWLMSSYINRKWPAVHTQQVIMNDSKVILSDIVRRDFILDLTSRFASIASNIHDEYHSILTTTRCNAAKIYTQSNYSILNAELGSTLECDVGLYEGVLSSNLWLLVYSLLLENLNKWVSFEECQEALLKPQSQEQD